MTVAQLVQMLAGCTASLDDARWVVSNRDHRSVASPAVRAPPRVLLCTSNGVGLGHVMRMIAVAEELRPDINPVLFTLSPALGVPVRAGLRVEHLPSIGFPGLSNEPWHDLLRDRVDDLIRLYRPRLAMFDGVSPYKGLISGLSGHRGRLITVWQRRAMWKPGIGASSFDTSASFHHIIEPGDYAQSYDRGITVSTRAEVTVVRPILLADRDVLTRDEACAQLNLDATATNVLIQLGAGKLNDVGSLVGTVVAALVQRPELRITVARSDLSADSNDSGPDVNVVHMFPICRYFAAFDFAVLAAGYNSFHEALAFRLPVVLVPNLSTQADDQDARSRWAHDNGMAIRWDGVSPDELTGAITRLSDPAQRQVMRQAMAELEPTDGAVMVADLIRRWIA